MESDQVIVRVARLLAEGKRHEAVQEAGRALRAIVDERAALDERERKLLHLKSSAEIILQTIALDTIYSSPPTSAIDPSIRKRHILDTALNMVRNGKSVFSVDDLRAELDRIGYSLDVTRPGSVIGTVLNGDDRFRRKEMGVFEYIEPGT